MLFRSMKQWGQRPEDIDPDTTARVPIFPMPLRPGHPPAAPGQLSGVSDPSVKKSAAGPGGPRRVWFFSTRAERRCSGRKSGAEGWRHSRINAGDLIPCAFSHNPVRCKIKNLLEPGYGCLCAFAKFTRRICNGRNCRIIFSDPV